MGDTVPLAGTPDVFDNDLGLHIDAYDSSIDTSDGTLGIETSLDVSVEEDGTLLSIRSPTVDDEP